MRNLYRLGLAAVVLVLAAGGLTLAKTGPMSFLPAGTSSNRSATAGFDAGRIELDRRIQDARQAGKLHGITYFALLEEQQKLLVAQRRVEAQGYQPDALRDLAHDLDRARANVDRHLASH